MDHEAFAADVERAVNDGEFIESWVDSRNIKVVTGETWIGTLFGAVLGPEGFITIRRFDEELDQHHWFVRTVVSQGGHPATAGVAS